MRVFFFRRFSANATYEVAVKNLATHFSDTDYVDVSLAECADLCRTSPGTFFGGVFLLKNGI